VLGEIQTDRGNLHMDGSSCDSSNNDHPTALRCRGAGAVHHTKSGLMHRSKKGRGEEDKDDNLESP
jgi:hypothetical protein